MIEELGFLFSGREKSKGGPVGVLVCVRSCCRQEENYVCSCRTKSNECVLSRKERFCQEQGALCLQEKNICLWTHDPKVSGDSIVICGDRIDRGLI